MFLGSFLLFYSSPSILCKLIFSQFNLTTLQLLSSSVVFGRASMSSWEAKKGRKSKGIEYKFYLQSPDFVASSLGDVLLLHSIFLPKISCRVSSSATTDDKKKLTKNLSQHPFLSATTRETSSPSSETSDNDKANLLFPLRESWHFFSIIFPRKIEIKCRNFLNTQHKSKSKSLVLISLTLFETWLESIRVTQAPSTHSHSKKWRLFLWNIIIVLWNFSSSRFSNLSNRWQLLREHQVESDKNFYDIS